MLLVGNSSSAINYTTHVCETSALMYYLYTLCSMGCFRYLVCKEISFAVKHVKHGLSVVMGIPPTLGLALDPNTIHSKRLPTSSSQ